VKQASYAAGPADTRTLLTRLSDAYVARGRPLLPLTRWLRGPLRWYYHRSRLLRHDHRRFLKPRLLTRLHTTFVGECPADFTIYGGRVRFRSTGSVMSLQGYYVGEIEYHLMRYVVSQLRPNMVMLDVGAHHGAFTTVVAYELKQRGWKGLIHSFEPDPRNFALLEHNVRSNGLTDYVVLHQQAVADRSGVQTFHMFRQENSANTLEGADDVSDFAPDTIVSQQVETVALDDLRDVLPTVQLIKMDIQGAEPLALEGARDVLVRDRPILVIESVPGHRAGPPVVSFLQANRYTISGLTADSRLCALNSPELYVSWDWVALPE